MKQTEVAARDVTRRTKDDKGKKMATRKTPAQTNESPSTPDELEVGDFGKMLMNYLNTTNGHEIVKDALSIMGKNTTQSAKASLMQLIIQTVIVVVVIIVTGALSAYGKFDASIGVLFGAIVGFAFGKKI